ncbi:PDC1_MCP_like domain containing protein [Flavobacteriaceae bacterium]
MKEKLFCIFLFALTAEIATANSNSISTIYLENFAIANKDSVALDNAYMKVLRDGAACTLANTPNFGTRIIVALDKIKFKSNRGTIKIKRGKIAVFLENEFYDLPKGSYFEIALKKNHPPLTKPSEWVEPTKNIVIYENAEFRVFEERLNPGDERPLHSHAQRVVVRLNQVQLTDPRNSPNGKPGTGIQVANTVKFAEPMVHVTKNLSEIPLFNIVIEYKIEH